MLRLLSSSVCCLALAVAASMAAVTIEPAGKRNFGSGASVTEQFYYPGGIPNMGTFIGHPNQLFRRDRAVFRYDLSPFLLEPGRVKNVTLSFSVAYISGSPDSRKVRVEHFRHPLEELTGAAVADSDVETAQVVDVVAADCTQTSKPGRPKQIDVTKLIKRDLEQGFSSVTFRFLDETVEAAGGSTTRPTGTMIDSRDGAVPSMTIDLDK